MQSRHEKGHPELATCQAFLPTRCYQPAGMHNRWVASTREYYGIVLVHHTIMAGTMVGQSLH